MLNVNPTAAHHLVVSLMVILTIYLMITKYPQNGISKGISTLLLVTGQQGKLLKMQFGQRWRSSINQLLFLFTAWLQFCGQTLQEIVETANSGKIGKPTAVEKMDRCSCVGVGKDPGRNFVP